MQSFGNVFERGSVMRSSVRDRFLVDTLDLLRERFGFRRLSCVFVTIIVAIGVLVAVENTASDAEVSCASAASDPDGDGWGWEGNASCRVVSDEGQIVELTQTPSAGNEAASEQDASGRPICLYPDSDPDGDGFGWENNFTCVVDQSGTPYPTQASPGSVPGSPGNQGVDDTSTVLDQESEAIRQAGLYRTQVNLRLGEQRAQLLGGLIEAVGVMVDVAVISSGDGDWLASTLPAVHAQLDPLVECPAQRAAIGVLLVETMERSFQSAPNSVGRVAADFLSDMMSTLDGNGLIVVQRDICVENSPVPPDSDPGEQVVDQEQSDLPTEADPILDPAPEATVAMVSLALGVFGADAELLAARIHQIQTLLAADATTVEMVVSLNEGIKNTPGVRLALAEAELAALSARDASTELIRRITAAGTIEIPTNVGGRDGEDERQRLRSEQYRATANFNQTAIFQNWLEPAGESNEVRAQSVVDAVRVIQANEATLQRMAQGSRPSEAAVSQVENAAAQVWRGLLDTKSSGSRVREMYTNITTGFDPQANVPARDRVDNGHQLQPFANWFNAASTTQRAEAYGIDATTWELTQPFMDLYVSTRKFRKSNYGSGKIKAQLLDLVKIGFTILLASQLGPQIAAAMQLTEGTAAFYIAAGGTGSAAANLLVSGDLDAAINGGIAGAVTGGLRYFQTLGALTNTQKVMKALLLSEIAGGSGTFGQNLVRVFAGEYLRGFGERVAELDGVSPFTGDLLEKILTSAVIHGGDWDKINEDVENYLSNLLGGEVASFISETLPQEWHAPAKALSTFAVLAHTPNRSDSELRSFFFTHVIPQLELTGGDISSWFESENEMYNVIGRAILEISVNALTAEGPDALEQGVTQYVHRLAGDWASQKLVGAFTPAGQRPSPGVSMLARVLNTYIRTAYDPVLQERMFLSESMTVVADAFILLAPNCGQAASVRSVASINNQLKKANSPEKFEEILANTLTDVYASEGTHRLCRS